ncbi:MAG: flavodoxin [Anaerolineae bacterium]|nr:flavodoxin [Anaerolineae bacterium]
MAEIGMFYGSNTGFTEEIARQIKEMLDHIAPGLVEVFNVAHATASDMARWDCLIFGMPTVNIGQLQDDWDVFWPHLDEIDFTGKQVAIFGLGDQYNYSDTFLDAVGILANKVKERGGTLVGEWPIAGYQFENSLALDGDHFMGLALDEDNEPELTQGRLDTWIPQVLAAFGIAVDQPDSVPVGR